MKTTLQITVPLLLAFFTLAAQADIVLVVSAKSSVGELSKQQVSDLFLGKATSFPDGKLAVPLDQAEGSPARDEFHGKTTGKSSAQLKAYWAKQVFSGKGSPPKEVPGSSDVKKLVAENPSMIGYVDKSLLDASLKPVYNF